MNTLMNFATNYIVWWIAGAGISLIAAEVMGNLYKKSGTLEYQRKKWKKKTSQFFAVLFCLLFVLACIAIAVKFWRAYNG